MASVYIFTAIDSLPCLNCELATCLSSSRRSSSVRPSAPTLLGSAGLCWSHSGGYATPDMLMRGRPDLERHDGLPTHVKFVMRLQARAVPSTLPPPSS
jgi:hypothetical protein